MQVNLGMALNDTETATIVVTENRSVFFSCPYAPYLLWNLNGKTFSWILLGITCIASPATIILNISVIIAVKRRKELQNPWTTLSLSMAIADLLVGALSLSISAAICLLIVHQVCIEHVCILDIFNVHSMYCLSMCSSVVSFDCDCLGWIHGGGKMDGLQDNRLQNPGHEVSHNLVVLSNISNSSFPDNGTVKCERCDLRKDLHHLVRLSSDCLNP